MHSCFPFRFTLKCAAFQNCRCLSIYHAQMKKPKSFNQKVQKHQAEMQARAKRISKPKSPVIEIPSSISISELAQISNIPLDRVIDAFYEVAPKMIFKQKTIIEDFNLTCKAMKIMGLRCATMKKFKDEADFVDMDVYPSKPTTDKSLLSSRSPVVTIMGHIDHGKTTLLDALRKSNIAQKEAGGITQAIGAFSVTVADNRKITFLDTPGHAAFTSMRKRGAKVTDLVVLVVAADDSVLEQTVESIKIINLANIPFVVAINKCDLSKANPKKVYEDLAEHGVVVDKLGGTIQSIEISALKGKGLPDLIECLLLQADLLDISANNSAKVEGIVIESRKSHGVGAVTSVVLQQGTLQKGQWFVAGTNLMKVRGILDENNKPIAKGFPGWPVQVFGWKSLPNAGDIMLQVENETKAKKTVEWRKNLKSKEKEMLDLEAVTKIREELKQDYLKAKQSVFKHHERIYVIKSMVEKKYRKDESKPELNIILKADVDGSIDALFDVLDTYDCHHQCTLNVADFGIGAILESDIEKASYCQGKIVCFNVEPSKEISNLAESRGVKIIYSNVIYRVIGMLKDEMTSLLPDQEKVVLLGDAEVKATFKYRDKKLPGLVAGCTVQSGEILSDKSVQLVRNNEILYQGPIFSLKANRSEVDRISQGNDCGLVLNSSTQPEVGDIIRCCDISIVNGILQWNPPGF